MYGDTPRDKAATLMAMRREAVERARWDQTLARELFAGYVRNDARFAGIDEYRLVDQADDCERCGKVLDLDDPSLRPGGVRYDVLKRV